MASEKRPPRIPFSPEEVQDFIKLKNFRERAKIEKFKSTKFTKYLMPLMSLALLFTPKLFLLF